MGKVEEYGGSLLVRGHFGVIKACLIYLEMYPEQFG